VTKDKPLNRRGVLSIVNSVYDPLGLISPFILPAKRIIQELCRKGVGWDDCLPENEFEAWQSWRYDQQKLKLLKVKRCVMPRLHQRNMVHATSCLLRATCCLKLELTAATLAVKIDKLIRYEMEIRIDSSFFWTDSTIVLQYIYNDNKRFHTFVANRVVFIGENSEPRQ